MASSMVQFYDPKKKRTVRIPIQIIVELKPKIVSILMGKNSTTLKMAPKWFKHEDQSESLRNIVYPVGVTEHRPFDTVARYRAATAKPDNDFRHASLSASENSTETLVIALDTFAQQFGGELSFTSQDLSFSETAHRTACGVATLSSAHLLATDFIPTAKFTFKIDLDYDNDLARSSDTMQNFVLSFSKAIAGVLSCQSDFVRMFSLKKPAEKQRYTNVNFGLTTPDQTETKQLAHDLQELARTGFPNHKVLRLIKPADYECQWMPLISFLQLQPTDFVSQHNFDYKQPGMPETDERGGYPYHLPIGWYRHALKVDEKYPGDPIWLGRKNISGEWPVAFHGTHAKAVKSIAQQGLMTSTAVRDAMVGEAVRQKGEAMDRPGLYLATHCNGGAHPSYTSTFTVKGSLKSTETFRVVFQCRVKPGAFTTHTRPVDVGEAWRVVDPDAVRPYGILVKKEETPN